MNIRIGIAGYGNLGKGVEQAVRRNPDMDLVAIFTRRDPSSVKGATVPVESIEDTDRYIGLIDVMVLCGGSATDLPWQTPELALKFNVVDSFDTHAEIGNHFDRVDAAARFNNHTAVISAGWDPGLFSIDRVYADAVLPGSRNYTFWGRGVSQGHSDAIRRIPGVRDARQYTCPVPAAVEAARSGGNRELTTREMHTRECYVVLKEGADAAGVEKAIKTMPNYFADYDTTVHFITEEELLRDHSGLPHGGFVIRGGATGAGVNKQVIEYRLTLDSNPEFTGSVLAACARAAYRMSKAGDFGCKTVLDIAPAQLSPLSADELRHRML